MKYAVDKIENDIVLLENIKDGIKKEVNKKDLPNGVKETDILSYNGNAYVFDNDEKEKRLKRIKEKMNRLRRWLIWTFT